MIIVIGVIADKQLLSQDKHLFLILKLSCKIKITKIKIKHDVTLKIQAFLSKTLYYLSH